MSEKQIQILRESPISALLITVQIIANKKYGGHFTILNFTTNCRVGFRTPNDNDFTNVKPFEDLKEALINAIIYEPCW